MKDEFKKKALFGLATGFYNIPNFMEIVYNTVNRIKVILNIINTPLNFSAHIIFVFFFFY